MQKWTDAPCRVCVISVDSDLGCAVAHKSVKRSKGSKRSVTERGRSRFRMVLLYHPHTYSWTTLRWWRLEPGGRGNLKITLAYAYIGLQYHHHVVLRTRRAARPRVHAVQVPHAWCREKTSRVESRKEAFCVLSAFMLRACKMWLQGDVPESCVQKKHLQSDLDIVDMLGHNVLSIISNHPL